MAVPWETVHIFISSTFNDMHAERDYLVKQVFPQLREWCEKRKLRLVDIDLRWGVTEQDAHNQSVVKVCLDRIDDCRPFFLCFLGQRRGWVPKAEEISVTTFEQFAALQEHAGAASVTEMEILHAVVNPLHRGRVHDLRKPGEFYEPSKYAFFYLRDPAYLDQLPPDPPQLRQIYTNEGIEKESERLEQEQQLKRWREVEIPATGRPVRHYQAHWNANLSSPELLLPLKCPSGDSKSIQRWQDQWNRALGETVIGVDFTADPTQTIKAHDFNQRLSTGRLADFQVENQPLRVAILQDLQQAITERYPEHVETAGETDLQVEIDQQEQFLYIASQGFIEREEDFNDLDAYVEDNSDQLFVLTAESGMGKSTLLANWVDRYRTAIEGQSGQSVHFRFIGQSDRSTTVYSLLRWLLQELKEVCGKFTEKIPDEPQKLRQELPNLLEAASKSGKTVIVLDALNQLESGLSDLDWLPYRLPKNIKLIVSFKRGEKAAEDLLLNLQGQVFLSEVKPFETLEHRRELVNKYLEQFLKQLDHPLLEALIDLPGASNPLYLKVVLSELRIFGAFANLGEKIRSDFGETPVSAFISVLQRLENDPAYSPISPKQAVPLLFGLLAHARQGLSVGELTSLFIQIFTMKDDQASRQSAIDTVHLYLRQVRPFLAQRDGRYDFFFDSFKLAAQARYVSQVESKLPRRQAKDWHTLLAVYFGMLPIWENKAVRTPTLRKATELAYQQLMGNLWPELYATLTDFQFLEARCRATSVYDLEADYRSALATWQGEPELKNVLGAFEERLSLESHAIHKAPELLFPQLHNHLTWLDKQEEGPLHTLCEQARLDQHNWLRLIDDPRPSPPIWRSSFNGPTGAVNVVKVTPDGKQIVSVSLQTIQVWDLKSSRLLRTLEGHTSPIYTLALTPDGSRVISGSSDMTIKVWDLMSGRLLRTLEGHTKAVKTVALTPDGRVIVSGAEDKAIKIWDLESGQLLRTLEGHTSSVTAVAVTPDGQQVVSGSWDKTIKVWDLHSGRLLRSLEGHARSIEGIALIMDGQQVVSLYDDHTIKVWELENGRLLLMIEGLSGNVNAMTVTPDGRKIISLSTDKVLKVCDLTSGQLLCTLEGHTGFVEGVTVTPDSQQVVSGSWDATIKVWELSSGRLLQTIEGPSHITAMVVTPDGQQIVTGTSDKTIKVWELASGRRLRTLKGHQDNIRAVSVTPDNRRIVSCSNDKTIKVWDLESGELMRSLEGHTAAVTAVALTPDGRQIVSGSKDDTLKVWDLESGRLLHSWDGHSISVLAVTITPNGRQIVSGSNDKTLKVWDLESGRLLRSLAGHTWFVEAVTLTPDGRQVVSGSFDNTLKVWDLESGKLLHSLEGHTGSINAVAMTPDGKKVISGSFDNTLKVWDLESGKLLRSFEGHTASVNAVGVTPDGRQVISGSWDMTIKIWEIERMEQPRSIEGHIESVNAVAVSPDNRQVVSGSGDKTIKVWELKTGRLLRSLEGHAQEVTAVALTPDGRQIVSGSRDNTVKVWNLESGRLLRSLEGHTKAVTSVALTPYGREIVSGADDKAVKVWDLENGVLENSHERPDNRTIAREAAYGHFLKLEGHTSEVKAVVATSGKIVSGSVDHTLMVWGLYSDIMFGTLSGHSGTVWTVALTPNESKVISGSEDQTLKIWDLDRKCLLLTLSGHTGSVHAVALTPDGRKVVSGSDDKTVKVWDLEGGEANTLFSNDTAIRSLSLSSDGCWLACGDALGRLWIFEWIRGETLDGVNWTVTR